MYLRKVERRYKNRIYRHFLLVESVHTDKGPRQRIICSLGDLKPKGPAEWIDVFRHAVEALEHARAVKAAAHGGPPSCGASPI